MAMSRKDYVAIAEALNEHFHEYPMQTDKAYTELTASLIDAIRSAGNTNLDSSRFIQAVWKGL